MAKSPEKALDAATPAVDSKDAPAPEQEKQGQEPSRIEVNDTHAVSSYANFCRVTGSPEELIVDFALNPQPMGVPKDPIAINQRIIMNFFTAKRLLAALQMTLQRHEGAFGVLETDVQKRLTPQVRSSASAGS